MGLFHAFVSDSDVELIGVEAQGRGLSVGDHSATLSAGSYGIIHGSATYLLQDEDGQVQPAHSVAAGLDYPGVGPEHAFLKETGRARYLSVTDDEAIDAFVTLSRLEGIIPALESSHAVAQMLKMRGELREDDLVIVNISGRGDKDAEEISRLLAERGA